MQTADSFKRWLFHLNGPEAAPIILGQRRIFVLPTRAGFAYATSLILMLIGAINYNLSLAYALVFLLAGLGLVTVLHTFRNLVHIEISPGRSEPVYAGDRASFSLQLRNLRNSDRYAISLSLPGGEATKADLPANETTTVILSLPSTQRGWLAPGRITLETRFPLCLIRAWSYAEPDMRCLVYPHPETAPPPLPLKSFSDSGYEHGNKDGEDFSGLRTHQPADSPRHIAWKIVARGHPLLTKQFSGTNPTRIWLDWNELPADLGTEARLSRLTRWLIDVHTLNLLFGLRLPGKEIPFNRGPQHFQECLEALALHEK